MSAMLIGTRLGVTTALRLTGCAFPCNTVICLPHQTQFQHAPLQKRHIQLVPDVVRNYYLTPDFPPIGSLVNVLTSAHDLTGLPWWASIALTTVGLRTLFTLPLSIHARQIQNRRELLKPEIEHLARQTASDVQQVMKQHKWDKKLGGQLYTASVKESIAELYKRDNCHPFKLFMIPFIQIPLWLSFSFALRNMAGFLPLRGQNLPVLCPDMAMEGTLWFSNLLLPDAYLILPVMTMIINIINLEISVLSMDDSSRLIRFGNMCARMFSICLVPIGALMPSVIVWYWFLSAMTGMLQNIILRLPKFRVLIRLKPVPSDTDTPFRDIMQNAKKRYWLRERKVDPKRDQMEQAMWQAFKNRLLFWRKRTEKKDSQKDT